MKCENREHYDCDAYKYGCKNCYDIKGHPCEECKHSNLFCTICENKVEILIDGMYWFVER